MAAVSELVSGLDAELVRMGYKPSTMVWYRGCWRRLERYFASHGAREFSLDVAMAWVDEACGGFFEKEQAGALGATDVYVFRVAAMLDDFAAHGAVLRRYSRSVSKLSVEQTGILAGFQAWLGANGCAVSTVRAYGTVVGEFLAFTGRRGGLAGLDGGVIGARSSRPWRDIRPRRWSTSCARCGRFCGSPQTAGLPTGVCLTRSRRRGRAGRRGSRRYGIRPM
jgi:hypothetical protein